MIGWRDPEGSNWHRWDPHIHAPGTLFNDQFRGGWPAWLDGVENSDPPIRALGVTDYYLLESYAEVLKHKVSGRLPKVEFIFPNVELRLDIVTEKRNGLNVHLLARPDAEDHIERLEQFLRLLPFKLKNETFTCDRAGLIRLGVSHEPSLKGNDHAALRAGAQQFKVGWAILLEQWQADAWAKENILLAADASASGTSGLKGGQFQAIRQEIERHAHIIFSSKEGDRRFWLGQGPDSLERVIKVYNGPKPCLHGSDAHCDDEVGAPDLDRFCWIKSDLTFDGLEQAVFEPATRVLIQSTEPSEILDSLAIESGSVDAPWFASGEVAFNRGMVASVGARGSGKTALADIIAAGAGAFEDAAGDGHSFIDRAQEHLSGAKATLKWRDGETNVVALRPIPELALYPRIQYLSQQFVERLCSSEGVSDELLLEMKRVVFDAHDSVDRMGSANFDELLKVHTSAALSARNSAEKTLSLTISQLYEQWQRDASLSTLQRRHEELFRTLQIDKEQRKKLVGSTSDERSKRLDLLSRAADASRLRIDGIRRELQALEGLKAEVASVKTDRSLEQLLHLQNQFSAAGLNESEWAQFRLDYVGPVEQTLLVREDLARKRIATAIGASQPRLIREESSTALVSADADLLAVPLATLEREIERLRELVGLDRKNAALLNAISKKLEK